ncbi:hypothetical protein [Amycolatopsis plumensis]
MWATPARGPRGRPDGPGLDRSAGRTRAGTGLDPGWTGLTGPTDQEA